MGKKCTSMWPRPAAQWSAFDPPASVSRGSHPNAMRYASSGASPSRAAWMPPFRNRRRNARYSSAIAVGPTGSPEEAASCRQNAASLFARRPRSRQSRELAKVAKGTADGGARASDSGAIVGAAKPPALAPERRRAKACRGASSCEQGAATRQECARASDEATLRRRSASTSAEETTAPE